MMNSEFIFYNIISNEKFDSFYNNMSTYQKNIIDNFKDNPSKFDDYSLNDLLFDFDINFIEHILNIEIDLYLKNNPSKDNKRNGYTKDIDLTIGDKKVLFNRPRLRQEKDFNSVLIPKRSRIIKDLSNNIILLYSKNNSLNDIKDILLGMFGINISNATISNLINEISYDVLSWRNRNLSSCYFTINIDCTYISIRDQKFLNSHKIPIYIAIGTKLDGHKEILGIYLGNEDENKNIIDNLYNKDIAESKEFWIEVFNDLKDRGVKRILYIISDGIGGIEDAINSIFPNTIHQRCIVHLVKNLRDYSPKCIKNSVVADFKKVYTSPNKDIAYTNIIYFREKYKNYSTLLKHANDYFDLILPLFNVSVNIRNYIYTNNISESVNSKIKRGFYGRGALPNANSAINIIFINLKDLEEKWAKAKVSNWNNIYNEIIQIYGDDIKEFL